jgi:hypothetical protein
MIWECMRILPDEQERTPSTHHATYLNPSHHVKIILSIFSAAAARSTYSQYNSLNLIYLNRLNIGLRFLRIFAHSHSSRGIPAQG